MAKGRRRKRGNHRSLGSSPEQMSAVDGSDSPSDAPTTWTGAGAVDGAERDEPGARELTAMTEGASGLDDHLDSREDIARETERAEAAERRDAEVDDPASAELDPADAGKRLKRNILWNYGSGVTSLVALVLLFPVAVRLGGAHEYGLWVLIFGVSSLLGMTDFGLADGVVRLLGQMTRDGAPLRERRRFMTVAVSLFMTIAAISTAVYAIATPLYLRTVDLSALTGGTVTTLIWLGAIAMLTSILGRAMNCVLWSQDRQDIERKSNIAGVVLRCIGYVVVWITGGGVVGVALAEVIGSLVIPVVCTIAVARRFKGFDLHIPSISTYGKPLAKLSSSLFVGSFAMMLTFQVPLYVVGSALGLTASTAFSSIIRVYTAARLVNSWMADPFIHSISTSPREQLARKLQTPYLLTGLVGTSLAVTVGALGSDLLEAWMGSQFAFAGTAMSLLAIGILADAVVRPAIHAVNLRGNPWRISWLNVTVLLATSAAVWLAARTGSLTWVVLATVIVPMLAVPVYLVLGSQISGAPPISPSGYVVVTTLSAVAVAFGILMSIGSVLPPWPALLISGALLALPSVALLREVRRSRDEALGRHRAE